MPRPAAAVLAEIGRRVRALRAERGWTRRQLAASTGISERFLADVEHGRANPSVVKLCELADALGTTPAALLGGARPPDARSIVALLGLRGAGKSSVGSALAVELGCRFVELDGEVEQFAGLSLAQIFELNGEEFYRRTEQQVLQRLIDRTREPLVLATGGGIVTEAGTFELLRTRTITVWLRARPEDHWNRVVAQGDTRPMADHDAAFGALGRILDERRKLYALADLTIDTSNRAIAAISSEIAAALRDEHGFAR